MKNPFAHREKKFIPLFDWIAVLAGIGAFTALVMPSVLTGSAYFDEGYSAFLAKFDPLTIAAYTSMDVHPPLYYTVLSAWQWFVGDSAWQLRLLSVVFAWIAMLFGFLIIKRWFGQRTAWAAVLLMALSPLFIRYGATMRMYTMALAIAFAATYVLLRAVTNKNGKKWWIAYTVLVAAGMWTNYFMALVWVTHALWLLYEYGKKKVIVQSWRKSLLWALVIYLPWLPMLIFRYGEVQVNGFWIKPLSVDTLVSTVTQSVLFRSAADTTTWLAIGIITLTVTLGFTGHTVYKKLDNAKKSVFRLLLAMSALPIILLALGSLPPLRSSYVYRYVIVAALASTLVIAIIVVHAKFKKHDTVKRSALAVLTIALFACGAAHSVSVGNRNLDTNRENRIAQVIESVHAADRPASIVLRSPYSYYVAQMYQAPNYRISFLYDKSLEKIGSTKPLYDHPEFGIDTFDGLNKVWLIGEDEQSVAPPKGAWTRKSYITEYDNMTKKIAAAAAYYERVQ